MSSSTPRERKRLSKSAVLKVILPLLLIVGGTFAFVSYSGGGVPFQTNSGTNVGSQVKVEFVVSTYHQDQKMADFAWLTQMALKGQFWQASCYFFCNGGVTYTLDPTTITDGGRNIEQCLVFGSAGSGDASTCTASNFPSVIALSTSSNSVTATDTYGGSAGPCTSSLIVTDSNGLAAAAGTVTAGASGSTVSTTIAKTFTASGTYSGVHATCLLSALPGGTNPQLYAEGTFGPDSLTSGNTLSITWTISRT